MFITFDTEIFMLTPRLYMIANNVKTQSVADIGTDHGYVPVYLLKNGIVKKAVATDIRKGPLAAAKRTADKYKTADKIDLRLGAGLAPIGQGETETIIIAGMGGELIKNILSDDIKKAEAADFLLLQPMNSQDILRKWLSENNFSILKEDIETEGFKVYNLIIAKKGKGTVFEDEFSLHLPHYLHGHKKFGALKEKKRREFLKIKNGLEKAANKDEAKIKKYSDFIKRTDEL